MWSIDISFAAAAWWAIVCSCSYMLTFAACFSSKSFVQNIFIARWNLWNSSPIHPEHRKFLQFLWEGSLFQFSCLCFGLSSAPWTFTKILKPLVAFLRKRGMRIVVYLDDFLILNQSKEGAECDFKFTVECEHIRWFEVGSAMSDQCWDHSVVWSAVNRY